MNVSLPDDLKAFVDQRVAADAYGSSSEYVRELIRRDQDVHGFRTLIRDAMSEPLAGEADADYFDDVRARIRARASG